MIGVISWTAFAWKKHETSLGLHFLKLAPPIQFFSSCPQLRQFVRLLAFRVTHDSHRTYMARAKKCMMA